MTHAKGNFQRTQYLRLATEVMRILVEANGNLKTLHFTDAKGKKHKLDPQDQFVAVGEWLNKGKSDEEANRD